MASEKKSFIMKLLADGETDTVSSKRLSMLIALIMLVGLSIASAFGYNCLEDFIWVFASFVLGQSGLTTVEKCTAATKKAKDTVKTFKKEETTTTESEEEEI